MKAILCLTILLTYPCTIHADETPPATQPANRVQVVRTVKDLLAQPRIDLGNGGGARLGISAESAPDGSGILIYCLTDHYTPRTSFKTDTPLGPFDIEVFRPGERLIAQHVSMMRREIDVDAQLLFACSIPISGDQPLRISLLHNKTEVGRIHITVPANEQFHFWRTWESASALRLEHAPDADPILHIKNPIGFAAIPAWNGMAPVAALGTDLKEDDLLPQLYPDAPSDDFTISLRDGEVLIESTQEFEPSMAYYQFLSRWWVNGKPFNSEKLMQAMQQMNGGGQTRMAKRMRLKMEIDPKQFGAKSGDRIELQLLYCPRGWRFSQEIQMLQMLQTHTRSKVVMSNKVEFVVAP